MVSFLKIFSVATLAITSVVAQPVAIVQQETSVSLAKKDIFDIENAFIQVIEKLFPGNATAAAATDVVCIFNSFTGLKDAPHTEGIEWYEDAEFLLGLILTSAVIELAENRTITTASTLITLIGNEDISLLNQFVGIFGIKTSLFNLFGVNIEKLLIGFVTVVVKTVVTVGEAITKSSVTANIVDTLINTAIQILETSVISFIPPQYLPFAQAFCTVGYLVADVATAVEACTINQNIISQVLSEIKIVLSHC